MKRFLRTSLLKIENVIAVLRSKSRRSPERIVVENYDGLANQTTLVIRGRVLLGKRDWEVKADDSRMRNFFSMSRLWLTDEVPHQEVFGEIAGERFSTRSDDQGYFQIELPRPKTIGGLGRWARYRTWTSDHNERFEGRIQTVSPDAERLIISDIDDTVIETRASRLFQMIALTVFSNVHTRRVFEGVSEFYWSLMNRKRNPIFFVTSSPWNLRSFLNQVFQLRGIPRGPAFMKDWGLDEQKAFKKSHRDHKLNSIRFLLDFYPKLNCVLLGDTGEKDPKIYHDVIRLYPGRVDAVYIRNVTEGKSEPQITKLKKLGAKEGIPVLFSTSSAEMDANAREIGLIETTKKGEPLRWVTAV